MRSTRAAMRRLQSTILRMAPARSARWMVALLVNDTGTVLGDLEAALAGPTPPWMQLVFSLLSDASPAIFGSLAGADTAIEIAAPFVLRLLELAAVAIKDLATHKPEADVKRAFDEALADILEDAQAPEVTTVPDVIPAPSVIIPPPPKV
jgi:hypothetical protein